MTMGNFPDPLETLNCRNQLKTMTDRLIIPDYCPLPGAKPYARPILIKFGWLYVVLGAIGVVTSGLPTTIFITMEAWAVARSSKCFHDWLYSHHIFGPAMRNWEQHRVIPPKAKLTAPIIMTTCMTPVAVYILTRASFVPTKLGTKPHNMPSYRVMLGLRRFWSQSIRFTCLTRICQLLPPEPSARRNRCPYQPV